MISKSIYKRNKIYWVSFYIEGKRYQMSTKATNKEWAEKEAERIIKNTFDHIYGKNEITLGHLVVKYHNFAKHKKSYYSKLYQIDTLLKFFKKETPLNDITTVDVENYVEYLREKRSRTKSGKLNEKSINRYLAVLKHLFNMAQKWEMYSKPNPVRHIKFFKEKPRNRFFTIKEIGMLCNAAKTISENAGHNKIQFYFYYILIIALSTGLRLGEILNLKWSSYKEGYFHIEEDKENTEKHVPIRDEVYALLLTIPQTSVYIFDLKRRSSDVIRNVWKKTKITAKIQSPETLRFHDTRRTVGVMLQIAGYSMRVVQHILGHQDIRTTQAYTPSINSQNKEAIESINLPALGKKKS